MNDKIKIKLVGIAETMRFCRIANSYVSDVNIHKGSIIVDGKDIGDVLCTDTSKEIDVQLISINSYELERFKVDMKQFEI